MNNIVYSPELITNLMSVRQLRSNGYKIVFGGKIEIIDRNNVNIIIKIYESEDYLFIMKYKLVNNCDKNVCYALPAALKNKLFGIDV